MSTTDLREIEQFVSMERVTHAFDFLKRNAPPEKRDDLHILMENVVEMMKSGEKVNVGDLVAELINPKKFALPQSVVEEFLKFLIGNDPDANALISGTIDYAKMKVWGSGIEKSY